MSDLPSIDDLMKKKPAAATPADAPKKGAPKKSAPLVDETVQGQFKEKMGKIALGQREVEAMKFAAQIGVPHINLEKFPISQRALKLMSLEEVQTHKAVSFYIDQEELRIAAVDPRKPELTEIKERIEEEQRVHGALYVISQKSYERILKLYEKLPVVAAITKDVEIKPEDLEKVQASVTDYSSLQALVQKTSTTNLVTFVLGASLKLGTSDVHIEAEEKQIALRFRVDGILQDVATIPKKAYHKLVSRVKLISGLKLNIKEKPQDGRFTIKLPDGDVDVRVSTLPTVYGESIVMRLLRQNSEGIGLEKLGFRKEAYDALVKEINKPNGMVITTGPTGSGKTTTLYSAMHMLNKPGVKIITLEDPVEYKMEGINQSQIDKSKDYTFGKGLRSILRQDPDIAMVGEIRDLETADIAIQAALTGHMMLSTLHTNSAAGAIPRFLSMGVKPFLLAPALNAIIGQRLVRKICEKCKIQYAPTADEQAKIQEAVNTMPTHAKELVAAKQPLTFSTGKGCEACNKTGYKGRLGVYEVLPIDKDMEKMILEGKVSEYDIEAAAIAKGMTTMVQDGILKTLEGETSLEEVFRVSE
jgi:type IV pilus assembly protein PilB